MNTKIKSSKNIKNKVKKTSPTIFPMGFGVNKLEDDIVIIDFIDKHHEARESEAEEDTSYVIISSIALSKSKALKLKESIEKAINGNEDNDNSIQ